MKLAIDSSVIIVAMNSADTDHSACLKIITSHRNFAYSQALSETFSTLTGGRLGFRVPASTAAEMLRKQVMPRLELVSLNENVAVRSRGVDK